MNRMKWLLAAASSLLVSFVQAQSVDAEQAKAPTGIVDQPCSPAVASNARQDWAGLCRYREANERLLASGKSPRIVFIGDSITEGWAVADPELFAAGVVNRGISGQTTPQMLVRFRADVIALKPQMVHILAGTNDIAGNTGPTTTQDVKNNIVSMVELARANGIRVALGSIPPAARFKWRPQVDPVPHIHALNTWLREYARQNRLEYIDYYAALVGTSGELKPEFGNDGVHPNKEGYRVMRGLVEPRLNGR